MFFIVYPIKKLLLVNEILREHVFTVYPGNMFNRNKRACYMSILIKIGDEQSVISPVTYHLKDKSFLFILDS